MSYAQSNAYNPSNAVDVVGVFDTDYNQLFADARPMKATVTPKAKVMKHTVESGATISDFRVIEPLAITLHMTLLAETYVNTYQQIKQTFLGDNVISVQTRTGLYANMVISEMPHDETAAVFDTITITLKLEEVKFALVSVSPLPASMTTKAGGAKNGTPATQTQTNTATTQTQQSSAAYSILFGK